MNSIFYNPQEAFFPVDRCNVYWEEIVEVPTTLFDPPAKKYIKHLDPDHFAIVDLQRNHVFSYVNPTYALFLNEDAYQLALELGNIFFSKIEELVCIGLSLESKRAVCTMDLMRKTEILQPLINDGWCAFIRFINSYNQTKKLCYELGFYNQAHGYSIAFPNYSLEMDTRHTGSKEQMTEYILSKACKGNSWKIVNIENAFRQKIAKLKAISMNDFAMICVFCRIFDIKISDDLSDSEIKELGKQLQYVRACINDMIRFYGNNAYALMNVIADVIANGQIYSIRRNANSYQLRLGKWVDEFIEIDERGLNGIKDYIDEYITTALWFSNADFNKKIQM